MCSPTVAWCNTSICSLCLFFFFSMRYEESCLEIGKRDGFPLLGSDVCGTAVIGVFFFFFCSLWCVLKYILVIKPFQPQSVVLKGG